MLPRVASPSARGTVIRLMLVNLKVAIILLFAQCLRTELQTTESSLYMLGAQIFVVYGKSSREKGCSGSARPSPFLLLPFGSPPLRLPLPGLELIRSAPVGAVRGRGPR